MNIRIKSLFSCIAAFAVIASASYTCFLLTEQSKLAINAVNSEFEKYATKSARIYVENVLRICQMAHKSETFYIENASMRMKDVLAKFGVASLSDEVVEARIFLQDNRSEISKTKFTPLKFGNKKILPKLDKNLNATTNSANIAPSIFAIKNDTFVDISILGKSIETGGMLRLATTLKDKNNKTMLNSVMSDEAKNAEIIRMLLARKSFFGIVRIAGVGYIASYEPIADDSGEIVGAIEYLKPLSNLKYIFENFESSKLSGDGFLWSIQNINAEPILQIPQDSQQDIKNTTNELRAEMSDILETAVSAGEGKITLKNIENINAENFIAFTLFKPWNMVLGATINKNQDQVVISEISNRIDAKVYILIPFFILSIIIAIVLMRAFCAKMLNALDAISNALRLGTSQNTKGAVEELTNADMYFSELKNLQNATIKSLNKISEVLSNLETNAQNLNFDTSLMSKKSEKISNALDLKTSQLTDIQARLATIAKATEILSEDSTVATTGIQKSLTETKESSTLLSELEINAKKLIEDSQAVELQFSEIKEKADQIESVVASIKSISERINMLAVNASIEAEINAEQTASFKDVTLAITKLSDSTAVAIIKISDMTSSMLNSVNSGITEMKNFSLVMQTCKESIKNVRQTVAIAQSTTLELSPKFEELKQNIYSHADNISNIEISLNRLNEKSVESKRTLALLKGKIATSATITEAIALKFKNFLNSNLR